MTKACSAAQYLSMTRSMGESTLEHIARPLIASVEESLERLAKKSQEYRELRGALTSFKIRYQRKTQGERDSLVRHLLTVHSTSVEEFNHWLDGARIPEPVQKRKEASEFTRTFGTFGPLVRRCYQEMEGFVQAYQNADLLRAQEQVIALAKCYQLAQEFERAIGQELPEAMHAARAARLAGSYCGTAANVLLLST